MDRPRRSPTVSGTGGRQRGVSEERRSNRELTWISKRGFYPREGTLSLAVDADTAAFDQLLEAMRMPKSEARDAAITEATIAATEVPLGVLESCPEVIDLCIEIGRFGLQASLSDAGVGAQMGRAAAAGAYQSVCINLAGLSDAARRAALVQRADVAWERARKVHSEAETTILVKLRESVPA